MKTLWKLWDRFSDWWVYSGGPPASFQDVKWPRPPRNSRPFHVEIRYKSGQSARFWCAEFKIERGMYTWSNASPRPLMLGVDFVESVWQLNPDVET